MPSSYTPPDVIVSQVARTRSAPRLTPQLPMVIIGPSRQIETAAEVGVFSSGDDLVAAIPSLKDGAVVDPASISLIFSASDIAGKPLGSYRLSLDGVDADAAITLDTDGNPVGVRVYGNMALQYSTLSARNNDTDLFNDDAATLEPNGIFVTDTGVDFAARATETGDTFITITAPPAAVGDYKVVEMIPTGANVYTLRVVKVVDRSSGVAELQDMGQLDVAAQPAAPRNLVYGFADGTTVHMYGSPTGTTGYAKTGNLTDLYGTKTFAGGNITAGTDQPVKAGVGVAQTLMTKSSLASLLGGSGSSLMIPGTTGDARSAAITWFKPGTGVGLGNDSTEWKDLIAAARVGHWLRFEGTFGTAAEQLRDFRIMSVDTALNRIQLQDTFASTVSVNSFAVTGSHITAITLIEVLKGADDVTNGAGDFLVSDDGVTKIEIRRAAPFAVELVSGLPAYAGNLAFSFQRGVSARNVTASYDCVRTLVSGFSGPVTMAYTAKRTDLALNGLMDIATAADISEKLGLVHPDNPLALAADIALRAGGAVGNQVFFALSVADEGPSGYASALEFLESTEQAYYIVPLSQDRSIISVIKSHVDTMSLPENKGERIALVNTVVNDIDNVYPVLDDQAPVGASVVDAYTLSVTGILDWGVLNVGDDVVLVSADNVEIERRRIRGFSAGGLIIETLDPIESAAGATYIRITTHPRGKYDKAEALRDYAKSLGDRRIFHVVPSKVIVTYSDRTVSEVATSVQAEVPGFYAAVALAAGRSTLNPAQPITNTPVGSIDRLVGSNDTYTPDMLNTIAEGGNLILVQRGSLSAPTVRHQLSTDRTSIESSEMSITVAVDYTAKYVRDSLRPYIGRHNITDELLTQLRGICEGILRALVEARVLRRGSQLVSLGQNADRPDEVDIEISLLVQYPCNRINVKLTV